MSTTNHITKRCSRCKVEFPATAQYFHRSRSRGDGLQCYCKVCMSQLRKLKHPPEATFEELVWSQIAISDSNACWMWQGSVTKQGYGRIMYHKKTYIAHRSVYMLIYGNIPDELVVCHACDTPGCCNPAHLWIGTIADNNRDRNEKGRNADIKGELNCNAKLTETDVLDILSLCKQGIRNVEIARQYGVSSSLISLIKTGKVWSHIILP